MAHAEFRKLHQQVTDKYQAPIKFCPLSAEECARKNVTHGACKQVFFNGKPALFKIFYNQGYSELNQKK